MQQASVKLVMIHLHAEFSLLNHQTWEIPAMNEFIVNYFSKFSSLFPLGKESAGQHPKYDVILSFTCYSFYQLLASR